MRKHHNYALLTTLLVLCLTITLIQFKLQRYYSKQPLKDNSNETLIITIKPGDSFKSIANFLANKGWLSHPDLLTLLVRVQQLDKHIRAGDYQISASQTKEQLIDMLTKGNIHYYQAIIVEGLTIKEVIKTLNQHEKLTAPLDEDSYQQFLQTLNIKNNAEGLFLADTFFFESGDTVASLLKRSHHRLKQYLQKQWPNRKKTKYLKNDYQALILASLIEKETSVASERSEISGVFMRRLEKNMRLQTDPSVIYGLHDLYQNNLNSKLLHIDTPYNTYLHKGLPPTPITVVGYASIDAALHPNDGQFLYFVAKGDGTHYFSHSLKEHNKAVLKYQIHSRKKNYRSTPKDKL